MQRLKCLAVNPQWNEDALLSFPLGLATICSIIKEEGHDVQVLDFDAERISTNEKTRVLKNLPFNPDICLITGMITNCIRIRDLAHLVRSVFPRTLIILGGSLSSTAPQEILQLIPADLYVIGEGDQIIRDCLMAKTYNSPFDNVPGLIIKNRENKFIRTSPPSIVDVSQTPAPLYAAFPMEKYKAFLENSGRCFEMYSSKGCPFNCHFCYKVSGSNVRFRLVDNVISEMKMAIERYSIKKFSFEDDCFGTRQEWLKEFCKKVKSLKIRFRFQTNGNILNDENLDIMQDAGVSGISFGIESGSKRILKEYGKSLDLAKLETTLKKLKERSIQINSTFIVGAPGENEESIQETKDFILRNGYKNNFQVFFLSPYPGTKIFDLAVNEKKIQNEVEYISNLKLQDNLNLNLTAFPDKQLIKWRQYLLT